MSADPKPLFRYGEITFSIPEGGAFDNLPPAITIERVGLCPRCHSRPQFCFIPAWFLMWCRCCIVTGPIADFVRPLNPQDWTRLVLDEVDVANKLKDHCDKQTFN
jgi:hypothetical protein